MPEIPFDVLEREAREAALAAYAPYSRFSVGAAVLTASGRIFRGCNVENASYGLTVCAERNALFQSVVAGEREVVAVALFTPTEDPSSPCGACRQVLLELAPEAQVMAVGKGEGPANFLGERPIAACF